MVGYDRNGVESKADDGVDRLQEHRNIPMENVRCAAAGAFYSYSSVVVRWEAAVRRIVHKIFRCLL